MSAQKLKPVGALGSVLGILGFSVIAGVLVTAMVTPALAVTSLTAKSSIGVFENLPDFIQIGTQSQQNQIMAKQDGKDVQIASVFKQNREEVSWENVSPFLRDAAVDGEDRRFYSHGGVDLPSVVRAAVLNQTQPQNVKSGSSTLDMQLVRNILVQQAFAITDASKRKAAYADAIVQTYDRKLKEMKLAIGLDKRYTKRQILLGYLNIVGMGGTTYGVESGAEQYFSVSAKDVTLAQAASLIAIVQQPNAQSLDSPKKYAANKLRRDSILNAMLTEKHITQKQHDDAVNTTIQSEVKLKAPTSGCRNTVPIGAAWACDYVVKLITVNPPAGFPQLPPAVTALGANPAERLANWNRGGYKIYTSINLNLQAAADASIAVQAPYDETAFPLGAVADTIEAGTGRVLVMAENKVFDDVPVLPGSPADPTRAAVNFSTDLPWGGSGGFPTGSTFKVFDIANWLSNGHGLGDLVDGSGPQIYNKSSFAATCLSGGSAGGGTFPLQNDGNSSGGTMSVKQALIGSVNNAFMHMAEKQDLCSIRDTAEAMGAHRADGKAQSYGGSLEIVPNFILGSNEQAPLTIAAAGATVAANGLHCLPIIIDSVVNPSGATLPGQAHTCNQAISPEVSAGVANAMQGSMTSGTSSPANPHDGVPYAGKTGTSNTADHVWIDGLTTKLATTVWTGNIAGHASLRQYRNPQTGSYYASSSRFAIFKAIMSLADADPQLRGGAFPVADSKMLSGSSAVVPDVGGQSADQANTVLTSLNFQVTSGGTVASALPVGRVVSTDPPAGTKVPEGQNVTMYTSDGTLATTMPNVVGLTKRNALTAITGAGFTYGNVQVSYVKGGTVAQLCQVMSSDPAASSAATKTDPVTIKIYGESLTGLDPGTCN